MHRIRIKKLPTASLGLKMGDQNGFELHIADGRTDNLPGDTSLNVRNTLPIVPREEANVEAEKGETIVGDFDGDGNNEHSGIGGKPHYAGGTNIQVPPGSFIFSNNRKLRIGGKVLEEFGKNSDTTKKYTPAELAKQYNLNEYKQTLNNPASDHFDNTTASLMYANNQDKLSKLAFLQEAMKGFPNGIPEIATPVINNNEQGIAKYGGLVKADLGLEYPVDPYKGDKNSPRPYQQKQYKLQKGFNQYSTPWLANYGYPNTSAGFEQALTDAGYQGDKNNNKEVQKYLIAENLRRGNSGLFNNLLHKYGLTNQGINSGLPESTDSVSDQESLEKIFADGKFGVRSGLMLENLLDRDLNPSMVRPVPPFEYNTPTISAPAPTMDRHLQLNNSLKWKKDEQNVMPWWSQDLINTGEALVNRYNLKKYPPPIVTGPAVLPEQSFYGYRNLFANQEQAAQQNMMAAMFAGPQRLRSVASNIQGQTAAQNADTIANIQNLNVGAANQLEGMKADILNNKSVRDSAARKQYVDELTTMNQQYDNSVREANESFRTNLISGITNAQRTGWLNKMNSQFNIDPTSGKIFFTKGNTLTPNHTGSNSNNFLDTYKNYYDQFLQKMNDPQKAHEFAQKMTFGTQTRFQANNEGDSQMSTSGYGTNPMAMQLLGMYAPQFLSR